MKRRVFGGNYGEVAMLNADSEVAQRMNEKGDLTLGDVGDNFVYGSVANDALFGGDGHDLIVSGGDDDAR